MKQILLNARECSGRGVRIKALTTDQRANVLETSALEIGKDATYFQLQIKEGIAGVCAMVAEVTKKGGFKKPADLLADGVEWVKTSNEMLTDKYETFFNSKDMDALVKIFRTLHDVSEKEVTDILGEALPVTED